MNDTKWHEVFLAVARHRAGFQVAFVRDPAWNTESIHFVLETWVKESGLRDPGIGGPCSYREILWIRFPTSMGQVVQTLEPLLADLGRLGQLPITKTDTYIEIRGYQELLTPDAP